MRPTYRRLLLTLSLLSLSLLALLLGLLFGGELDPAQGQSTAPTGAMLPMDGLLNQAVEESPQLLRQLLLALVMTLCCTVIHLAVSLLVVQGYKNSGLLRWASRSSLSRIVLIAATGLATFIAMVLEIGTWAWLFLKQGAVSNVEQALYFSSVTFASLGYGDITLPIPFRLLASLEALVGILMAGWSTALLVAVAQKCLALRLGQHTPDSHPTAASSR